MLFITSLVAGYFFLRSPGKRTALTLAVVPLALLRNGFRIFTIGQLCIHIGPEMINSPIHRRGGPCFSFYPWSLFCCCCICFSERTRRGMRRTRSTGLRD